MPDTEKFKSEIESNYQFKGESILLGCAMLGNEAVPGLQVRMPLSMVNRHGLIAGATGTGKTKTVQVLAEAWSEKGVSVLVMDVKGDLSGLAAPGNDHPKIQERHAKIGEIWNPQKFPVELLSISDEPGVRLRATVSEFGPILFSKILELNENQQGVVAIVFKYCDDNKMPLLDIKDFRKALQYVSNEGKKDIEAYGQISPASAGVILRKLLELEQQGADKFFGEKSFDVKDLLRKDGAGKGFINILRICDIQDRPKLFSSFMLCLLAEVYANFEELGDKAAPRLVIVIDEAHLVFKEATKTLLDQLEMVVKLIRSKGVGIYFCTQVPSDVPEIILSQLGAKFQHSMRAFTANDRKDIRLVADNYPSTEFYKTESLLTELGIGEALITVLNEKGAPTPLAHTLLCAPRSRMDILTNAEIDNLLRDSQIAEEYNEVIDRESAFEILTIKLNASANTVAPAHNQKNEKEKEKEKEESAGGILDTISSVTRNPLVKTIAGQVTRSLMGALFGTSRSRRRR